MKYSQQYWDDVAMIAAKIPNLKQLYKKKILLTGGSGLICSAVADLCFYLNRIEGMQICLLLAGRSRNRIQSRFSCFIEGVDYFYVPFDAVKNEPVNQCSDYYIYGAGMAHPALYSQQPVETMLCNIVGLNCLLKAAISTDTKKFLYISSSEVYGKKKDNLPYREQDFGYVDILNARACYPSSKRAGETLCASYTVEYGIDISIVRPGHVYGPGMTETDSRATAQFIRSGIKGEDIIMKSAGTQLRSHCHSLDCASAILTVLLNGKSGEAYNISNINSISTIREFAKTVARISGVGLRFENPTETEMSGYNLMENSCLVSEKLEHLGWEGTFNLEQGIAKTMRILKHSIER